MIISSAEQAGVSGYYLLLARAIWAAVTLLSLLVFIASVQLSLAVDLFARMPDLAAELNVALFSIFANNQLLASNAVLLAAAGQFLAFTSIGLFLFWRKRNDWLAILVSAMLISIGVGMSPGVFFLPILRPVWHLPASLLQATLFSALLWFLYVFPDGRFVPSWTLPAALLWGLYAVCWLIWPQFNPHRAENFAALLIFVAWSWTGVVAQIQRLLRNDGIEHQQQKWVLIGIFFTYLFFGSLVLTSATGLNQKLMAIAPFPITLINTLFGFSILLIPISISFGILRYRLWDVDLFINRTLVYGALTAFILTFYGLSVGILSALVPAQSSLLVTFIALGVAAVAVVPACRFLKKRADRWLPAPPPGRKGENPATAAGSGWLPAHIAWIGIFAFLVWQFVVRLSDMRDILAATRDDYLVYMSLQLLPASAATFFMRYVVALRLGVTAVFWITATVIFWRKRSDWFALYVSFLMMLAPFGLVLGGGENGLLAALSLVAVGGQLLLPFLFPNGRFIPRSTRWRAILAGLLLLTPVVVYPIMRMVRADYGPGEWAYAAVMFTMAVMMAAGLVSQVYRYRRVADAVQRQQMKWVLVGFGVAFLWVFWLTLWLSRVLARLDIPEAASALIMIHLTILASAALPLTIGFSILRYRLWQVDLVINRALVFGGLTLLVTTVYILVVGILGALSQAGGNLLLSVLATGLIAILFHPLRQRLQQAVNRLMYGERDDPVTVLARLGKEMERTAVPGDTLSRLVETISQTLKLPYVAIEIGDTIVTSVGAPGKMALYKYPLVYRSQPIGQLRVTARAAGEGFTANEEQLLRNVARQAGPAVYAEQLTSQLQRSRQRLVTTREEERRRLRRDLHDGLGPQLATLTVKVNAAQNLLRTDPDAAELLLAEVKAESQSAIQEIRRVVQGLRPSVLDQLGLLSALREFAAQKEDEHTQITLQTPDALPPLPAAVEVAAYRIATEAVTNTMRHAGARHCILRLEVDHSLHLQIRDDGEGLPPDYGPGVGLSSMRERALELGGTFEIHSEAGQGAVITVRLPLPKSK